MKYEWPYERDQRIARNRAINRAMERDLIEQSVFTPVFVNARKSGATIEQATSKANTALNEWRAENPV